jgi:hypothetical protein
VVETERIDFSNLQTLIMSNLIETLANQLGGQNLSALSKQLGTDENKTSDALGLALPSIIAALQKNASSQEGATALKNAIDRDHDGSLLSNVAGYLQGSNQAQLPQADRMLDHLFGAKRNRVESGISNATGLDSATSGKLMKILAPMVLGAIGKQTRAEKMDAGGLTSWLTKQTQSAEQSSAKSSSLIGRLLDQDGDGDFDFGDVAKLGMNLLFKRKR